MVVDRNFINTRLQLHTSNRIVNYNDIIDMVRFWKVLLWEKYQARPGMKIGLALLEVDAYYISLFFAGAELGLNFVILDHPINKDTLSKTKAALFAPIDIGIYDAALRNDQLHHLMMENYCHQLLPVTEFDSYMIVDHSIYTEIADKIFAKENDVLIWASTSGTTSTSKPVPYMHHYVANLSVRNAEVFNYKDTSNVMHIRNMHHASSLLIHFLPTLSKCVNHWTKYVNFFKAESDVEQFVDILVNYQINFVMICNRFDLNQLVSVLRRKGTRFVHPVEINISGFHVDDIIVDLCQTFNLTVTSTFGSVDTGVPLFINKVTPSDTCSQEPGFIGVLPNDNFYDVEILNDKVKVVCKNYWTEPKYLQDYISVSNNRYYHLNRSNVIPLGPHNLNLEMLSCFLTVVTGHTDISVVVDKELNLLYLVLWDYNLEINTNLINQAMIASEFSNFTINKVMSLPKQKFTIDTKVNMDQLRGFLQASEK